MAPGTHCIGGWVDPRAGLDDMLWLIWTLEGVRLIRSQDTYYTDWGFAWFSSVPSGNHGDSNSDQPATAYNIISNWLFTTIQVESLNELWIKQINETSCSLVGGYECYEEYTVSVFRIRCRWKSKFLRNIVIHMVDFKASKFRPQYELPVSNI
jgi:hypothetical protein